MKSELICIIQKGKNPVSKLFQKSISNLVKRVNLDSISAEEYAGKLLMVLAPASLSPYTETWGLDEVLKTSRIIKSSFLQIETNY